ncbi:hypothetical protein C1645_748560 [Glomus cerebriforme]|uniref:Uncharacterized protein n=1 Tax=Glomus cerebriforme TaxID=658196 RepID=A0A397TUV9_9GLOM|nr:hypothetical protein C1645_748560 [Glomus cerebriforme]
MTPYIPYMILKQSFTINGVLSLQSPLNILPESVFRDLTREDKPRRNSIDMMGMIRYTVSKEAKRLNINNITAISILTNDLKKIASDQELRQYRDLSEQVNAIITSRCSRCSRFPRHRPR